MSIVIDFFGGPKHKKSVHLAHPISCYRHPIPTKPQATFSIDKPPPRESIRTFDYQLISLFDGLLFYVPCDMSIVFWPLRVTEIECLNQYSLAVTMLTLISEQYNLDNGYDT
jgi:hypothetical protein